MATRRLAPCRPPARPRLRRQVPDVDHRPLGAGRWLRVERRRCECVDMRPAGYRHSTVAHMRMLTALGRL